MKSYQRQRWYASFEYFNVSISQLEAALKMLDGNFRVAVAAASKRIGCYITVFWPGMEGDVALRKERNSSHPLRMELMGADTE